jgi:hypothetical protein
MSVEYLNIRLHFERRCGICTASAVSKMHESKIDSLVVTDAGEHIIYSLNTIKGKLDLLSLFFYLSKEV